MNRGAIILAILAGISVAGSPETSSAQACDRGTFAGAFAGEVVVPQNWDCGERQEFWFTDQGSQIVPYTWFLHLERADGTGKFRDPNNLDGYRYLPQAPTPLNPDGLPIGFTRGNAKANRAYAEISRTWLGMTCAACHTGQVEFEGGKYLIDGAPAMADFEGLARDLVTAMQATLGDPAKFDRFAAAVIADNRARADGGTSDPGELRAQLRRITEIRADWNQRNQGGSDYGHARLDAIGAIFNETAGTALDEPDNVTLADAPVSYPFVWDTPQHDRVQWNGSVENAGPGALGRNVGEVLGVFGTLDLNTNRFSRRGHASSVNVANLGRLEALMWQLQSPRWDDTELPAIDPALAARGRADYEQFCERCHADIVRDDPNRRIEALMFPVANPNDPNDRDAVGTDPTMARNFLTKTAKAPQLTGRFTRYWGILSRGEKFERRDRDRTSQAKILGYSVIGSITRLLLDDPAATLTAIKAGQPPNVRAVLDKAEQQLSGRIDKIRLLKYFQELDGSLELSRPEGDGPACFPDGAAACYKARPLNGIWATAPYLHNGSVRTMRDLLLPAAQRERAFKVGTRAFDPVDMGFRDDGGSTLDTTLPGNSNAGHDHPSYGNDILANDPARMDALLAYLKTL